MSLQHQVRGFLIPMFQGEQPNGEPLHGLTRGDYEKVRQGYACARCLAEFVVYTITCPLCGLRRDVAADIEEAPQLWLDHIAERNLDVPVEKQHASSPDEAIEMIAKSKDVEQIPLSKLRKRRR
jgi:hypothetical protein